jgi:hypothetical protein
MVWKRIDPATPELTICGHLTHHDLAIAWLSPKHFFLHCTYSSKPTMMCANREPCARSAPPHPPGPRPLTVHPTALALLLPAHRNRRSRF